MSANRNPKDLGDLSRWDADLLIACRTCGRKGVFELWAILNHFRSRGWSTLWGNVAYRIRCKGTSGDPGCGSKDLSAHTAPRLKLPPPSPRLSDLEMRQWAKRERR
jgi:hypothetical protein